MEQNIYAYYFSNWLADRPSLPPLRTNHLCACFHFQHISPLYWVGLELFLSDYHYSYTICAILENFYVWRWSRVVFKFKFVFKLRRRHVKILFDFIFVVWNVTIRCWSMNISVYGYCTSRANVKRTLKTDFLHRIFRHSSDFPSVSFARTVCSQSGRRTDYRVVTRENVRTEKLSERVFSGEAADADQYKRQ